MFRTQCQRSCKRQVGTGNATRPEYTGTAIHARSWCQHIFYSVPAAIAVEVPPVHKLRLAAPFVAEAANENADPARRVEGWMLVVGCITLSAGSSSAPCRCCVSACCSPCDHSPQSMCLTSAQGTAVCGGSICGSERSSRGSILRARLQAENDVDCSQRSAQSINARRVRASRAVARSENVGVSLSTRPRWLQWHVRVLAHDCRWRSSAGLGPSSRQPSLQMAVADTTGLRSTLDPDFPFAQA